MHLHLFTTLDYNHGMKVLLPMRVVKVLCQKPQNEGLPQTFQLCEVAFLLTSQGSHLCSKIFDWLLPVADLFLEEYNLVRGMSSLSLHNSTTKNPTVTIILNEIVTDQIKTVPYTKLKVL